MGQSYGSLNNMIADAAVIGRPEPEVGMGATMLLWTDRKAGTIVEVKVAKSGKYKGQVVEVTWQMDDATPNPESAAVKAGQLPGNSEFHDYLYTPRPDRAKRRFSLRENGRFQHVGGDTTLQIGVRDEYRDPSF